MNYRTNDEIDVVLAENRGLIKVVWVTGKSYEVDSADNKNRHALMEVVEQLRSERDEARRDLKYENAEHKGDNGCAASGDHTMTIEEINQRVQTLLLSEDTKTVVSKILTDHYNEVCATRDEYFGRARKIVNEMAAERMKAKNERDEALALVTGIYQDPGISFVTKQACSKFAEQLLAEHRAVLKERDDLKGELTVEQSHNAALVTANTAMSEELKRVQCGVKNIGLDVNEDPESYSTPQLIAIVREFSTHQSTACYRKKELWAAAERMEEMYYSYLAPCPHEQDGEELKRESVRLKDMLNPEAYLKLIQEDARHVGP